MDHHSHASEKRLKRFKQKGEKGAKVEVMDECMSGSLEEDGRKKG